MGALVGRSVASALGPGIADVIGPAIEVPRWSGPDGVKRPSIIGHDTNDIVYARIAPGVLDELQRKNPTLPNGHRKSKHHQWFTPELGHQKLKKHLATVIALMRAAANWGQFERSLKRAFPVQNDQFEMNLGDDCPCAD